MDSAIRLYVSVGFKITKEYRGNDYILLDMILDELGMTEFVSKIEYKEE